MTGLPHQRRRIFRDPAERGRIAGIVTVLVIALGAAALDLVCLVWGINIGREQERAARASREKQAALDSMKPVYGSRLFACSKEEFREYREACKQRLRSNLTGGM